MAEAWTYLECLDRPTGCTVSLLPGFTEGTLELLPAIMKPVVADPRRTNLVATLKPFEEDQVGGYAEPGQMEFRFEDHLLLACPGCGYVSGMRCAPVKPPKSPSWQLYGDKANISTVSLAPSINCASCCGWHGYLRNGIFTIA